MEPRNETEEQRAARIHASNQYQSFLRGWRDGASVTAMRSEFLKLAADNPLRVAYDRGYGEGRMSRAAASQLASELYGYEPQILRLQKLEHVMEGGDA